MIRSCQTTKTFGSRFQLRTCHLLRGQLSEAPTSGSFEQIFHYVHKMAAFVFDSIFEFPARGLCFSTNFWPVLMLLVVLDILSPYLYSESLDDCYLITPERMYKIVVHADEVTGVR